MSDRRPGQGRKKEAAVAALLSCRTLAQAAAKVGIGERTLRAWLKDDLEFRSAYAAARRQLLEHSLSRLQSVTGRAVTVLSRMLNGADPKLALRAALGVLDKATRGAETLDVLARLEALETAAKRREQRQ